MTEFCDMDVRFDGFNAALLTCIAACLETSIY